MNEVSKKTIRKLWPQIPGDEVEEAAQNLEDYLLLAWEVFEESGGAVPVEESPKAEIMKKIYGKPVDSIRPKFDSLQGVLPSLVHKGDNLRNEK